MNTAHLSLLALLTLGALPSGARADLAIHADGRRVPIDKPAQDSKGQWLGVIDGHRRRLVPGVIVALVNDEGRETSLLPELASTPKTAQQEAALSALADSKNELWMAAVESLCQPPTRGVFEALLELAVSPNKTLRTRALSAAARLYTRESALEVLRRVLAEKDVKVRRDTAIELSAIREILARCDARELIEQGLADRDALVRVEFALAAPLELELAGAVLRKDGLRHGDHHVRESAAVALGRRGDAAGETLLCEMLARSRLPGVEDDPPTGERLLVQEQLELCEVLGRLRTDAAIRALEKARSTSPHAAVRAAAAQALAG